MNEQVWKNLRTVKREAMDILDNVEKVRGKRYREFLAAMLLTTNLVEISQAMQDFRHGGEEVMDKLRECFFACLHQQMAHMFTAAGAQEGEIESLVRDAEKIHDSIYGLASKAVETGIKGNEFGERA